MFINNKFNFLVNIILNIILKSYLKVILILITVFKMVFFITICFIKLFSQLIMILKVFLFKNTHKSFDKKDILIFSVLIESFYYLKNICFNKSFYGYELSHD